MIKQFSANGFALALIGASLATSPADAHHSQAMFDPSKTITADGTVVELQWTNPHSWLIIYARDPGGAEGAYVVVEDEELKKIAPPTATTMDILQFVGNDEVDPIFFESSYYVAPEDKTAKPYTLFMAALEETKQDAIAKIAMHNREHIVLIRPAEGGLILHTLYYPDELHKSNKSESPKSKYSAKELELAKSLINHLKAPFKPQEFTDEYRENVERLIAEKQKGKKITTVEQPRKAPVIDLMEALKRSINAGSGKPGSKGNGGRSARKTGGRRKAA